MKKIATFIIGLFAILQLSICQNHPVTTKDGFFYLNGKKFFVKGIGLEITKLSSSESSLKGIYLMRLTNSSTVITKQIVFK